MLILTGDTNVARFLARYDHLEHSVILLIQMGIRKVDYGAGAVVKHFNAHEYFLTDINSHSKEHSLFKPWVTFNTQKFPSDESVLSPVNHIYCKTKIELKLSTRKYRSKKKHFHPCPLDVRKGPQKYLHYNKLWVKGVWEVHVLSNFSSKVNEGASLYTSIIVF